jgi:hypothetical protein
VFEAGGQRIALDKRQLTTAFAAAQASLEFDAYARTYAGHRAVTIDGQTIRLVPLRVGTKPVGLLATAGRPIDCPSQRRSRGKTFEMLQEAHALRAF